MRAGRPPIHNWALHTTPQPGLNGRRGFQPRGKALGGSSAINAMLYVRGHPSDYDGWADLGATGWDWASVLPYFLKSEGNARPGPLHGADGPLQVGDQRFPRPISRAFVQAMGDVQVPENPDFNGMVQEGAGLYQVTQFHSGPRKGERCSAAAAYLHPVLTRPNLTVLTRARAEKITFDGKRATGVIVKRGLTRRALTARHEVIVAQGTFGSPQLLMLSGIGPGLPPEKWSSLRYGFRAIWRMKECPRRSTSRRRSSPSSGRSMCWYRKASRWPKPCGQSV